MGKGKRLRGLRADAITIEQPAEPTKVEPTVQQMKDLGMKEFEVADPGPTPNRNQRRYFQKLMRRSRKNG